MIIIFTHIKLVLILGPARNARKYVLRENFYIYSIEGPRKVLVRDWSLITGRGGQKWENRGSETFCAPPSRQGSTFCAPPLKEWKLVVPPCNMAKTSSYRVKTTPKLFAPPPSRQGPTFCAPPLKEWKLVVPPLQHG